MKKELLLNAGWARLVYDMLKREGLDANSLFHQFGFNIDNLNKPNAYFSQDSFTQLWHEASRLTGNPAIGLKMAQPINVTAFESMSYKLMSCADVREGLECMVNYQDIFGSAAGLSLDISKEGYQLSFIGHGDKLPPSYQSFDASMAQVLEGIRLISNQSITPQFVKFAYPKPENTKPYQDLFNCPLRFSQDRYSICFRNKDLFIPSIFANKELAAHHEASIEKAIKQTTDQRLSDQVREMIQLQLPNGEPSIKLIASLLNMGYRKLQRSLKEENLTYKDILDDVRKKLAHTYVYEKNHPIKEIAILLGFSTNVNFYRAFNRWYGCSPGKYREQNS